MKKTTIIILLLFSFKLIHGQTTLSAGDIVITGFRSDDPDEFTFVLLTNVTAGTTITFTDSGWTNTNTFRANEGFITWTADTDLPCGTQITIQDNMPFSASIGSVTDSGLFQLGINGDQILAFQGTQASPTFIYAIDFNGGANNWNANATNPRNSALPLGLVNNTTAVSVQSQDNGTYDCFATYETAEILAGVSNNANWLTDNDPDDVPLGLCTYSCAAIPFVLSPGDLVITGYNGEDGSVADEFTFTVLTDIPAGTRISFTDKGWDTTTNNYRAGDGEGFLEWIAPAGVVPCGTEIRIFATSGGVMVSNYASNFGIVNEYDEGFGLSGSNTSSQDQIIAFMGNRDNPNNIYAMHYGANNWVAGGAITIHQSAIPTGLTDGTTAIYFGDFTSGIYDCSTVTNDVMIASAVADLNNWSLIKMMNTAQTLGGCNYSCCPALTWNGSDWLDDSSVIVPTGPTINETAIINADYNTITNGNIETCSLIINAGHTLALEDTHHILVQNDVTVDGSLTVSTEGNFVQVGDFGSFVLNSGGNVELTKTKSMFRKLTHTYWSSPTIGETIENTFVGVQANRRYLFNAANFVDLQIENMNTDTFTPGQDDIDDDGDDWQLASGTMGSGIGYAVIARPSPSFPSLQSFIFSGAFHNGEITVPMVNASGNAYNDWNLIGNPYPGPISVSSFLNANSSTIDGVVYYWDQATPESETASGDERFNFSQDDYASHNGVGGTGARSGAVNIPNGFISSGQGFFVESLNGADVVFTNSMRNTAHINTQLFKSSQTKKQIETPVNNKLWLDLSTDNGAFNQILIGYVDGATNANDGGFYDAKLNLGINRHLTLYSIIDGDNGKFVIQGKPKESLNIDETIYIGFENEIETETIYTFSIAQIEGEFLKNHNILLKDNLENVTHNLSNSNYNFTSQTGVFKERFEIVFIANSLSNNDFETLNNSIYIVELENDKVQFTTNISSFKSIKIIDLLGRSLYEMESNNTVEILNLANLKSAVYITYIELENGTTVSKKFIKH